MKCHATKKVTRRVSVGGKKVSLSGKVRCRKYWMAHVHHPDKNHSGQFNNKTVEWKVTDEERESYLRERARLAAQ